MSESEQMIEEQPTAVCAEERGVGGDGEGAVGDKGNLRGRVNELLLGWDQPGLSGHIVELLLFVLIVLNVVMFMLETVRGLPGWVHRGMYGFEAFSVVVFTVEYALRLWSCVESERYRGAVWGRVRYALRPMLVLDLMAILPFYLTLGVVDLRFARAFRLLRFARMAKLVRYSRALGIIRRALASRKDELVACLGLLIICLVVCSCLMYLAEHEAQPELFSSIPATLWWALETLTTVGYGDIYPVTMMGRVLAGVTAVLGIAVFALPTAMFVAAFLGELEKERKGRRCPHCGKEIGG